MTTRRVSEHGILRAGAILTRAGELRYGPSEVGLEGHPQIDTDGLITVHRTIESLSHPETIASLRGAPLTRDHPPGGLNPENWSDWHIGSVASEPRVAGDAIVADVLIGDGEALRALDAGERELSIGYKQTVDKETLRTVGPLIVNHVALVVRGRAGSSVRVMDHLPKKGASAAMDRTEIQALVGQSVKDALAAVKEEEQATDSLIERLSRVFEKALAPISDAIAKLAGDEPADPANPAPALPAPADPNPAPAPVDADQAAKDAAEKAAAELTEAVRQEERARFAVLSDAAPLLTDSQWQELADAEVKDVLVAACQGFVEDPANQSVDYLRGALKAHLTTADVADRLPNGVTRYRDSDVGDSSDPRVAAHKRFVENQMSRFKNAGIRPGTEGSGQ